MKIMNLKNVIAIIAVTLLTTISLVENASAERKFGIVTGSKTGTYIKIGQDISKLLRKHRITLNVHTSQGSLENIYSVFKLPKAQMGIVQSDVLAFISSKNDEKLRKIARKTRLLHPLYNEEVHILASNDVGSFDDLKNRKIAVGKKGSGTFLTATTLLRIAGLDIEPVYISGKEALKALKRGEVDAMFYVAGFPVKLFKNDVSENDKLQLLPIQNKEVEEIYNTTSTIPAGTYSWLSSDLQTVAVKAVLITYDYQRSNCQAIGKIGRLIEDNIDWLRDNGHPKWNEVDLSFKLNGWTQYECVLEGNRKSSKRSGDKEYEDFLKSVSGQ